MLTAKVYHITAKGCRARSAKRKAPGVESGGNQALASEHPLPLESHRMLSIPPAMNCETCVKCSLPGKLIRGPPPKVFYRGLVTQASLARQVPNFSIPGKKASVEHR